MSILPMTFRFAENYGFFWTRDAVSAVNRNANFVEGVQFVSSVLARSA